MSTREDWLLRAVELCRPLLAEHGAVVPDAVRVSVGWPRGSRKAIGQCWVPDVSADGTAELFISPELAAPERVLDVLAHELIHAAIGCEHGHKKPFTRVARAIGLDGKPTATVAGAAFSAWAAMPLLTLGAYPHAAMSPSTGGTGSGPAKQGTRMLKLLCDAGCGYNVRTTAKWLMCGVPACACGEGNLEPVD